MRHVNRLKTMVGVGLAAQLIILSVPAMPGALAQTSADPSYQAPNYQSTTSSYQTTQTTTPVNGQVNQQRVYTSRWAQASPATKIITGTAVGAAAGGATGLLTGMTMHATSHHAMKMARGTAAARGLAWGSVYGAGIGFLAGIASAIYSPKPVAVTSTGNGATYRY